MCCSVGDCDPLQRHWVSTSFGFLWVFLNAEQQELHGVEFIFDMRDAVEDGERLPHVFTEQRLKVQDEKIKRF